MKRSILTALLFCSTVYGYETLPFQPADHTGFATDLIDAVYGFNIYEYNTLVEMYSWNKVAGKVNDCDRCYVELMATTDTDYDIFWPDDRIGISNYAPVSIANMDVKKWDESIVSEAWIYVSAGTFGELSYWTLESYTETFHHIAGTVDVTGNNYEVDLFLRTDTDYFIGSSSIDANGYFETVTGYGSGEGIPVAKLWDNNINRYVAVTNETLYVEVGEFEFPKYFSGSLKIKVMKDGQEVAVSSKKMNLLQSYNVPVDSPYYDYLVDRTFVYDQALAVILATNIGDRYAAAQWCNALLLLFDDGQISFSVNSRSGFPMDAYYRTGAQFWCLYAVSWYLYHYQDTQLQGMILTVLEQAYGALGQYWDDEAGLYKGGKGKYADDYSYFDPDFVVEWWSTEHNIDAYFALRLMSIVADNPFYLLRADRIKDSLENLWNPVQSIAFRGLYDDWPALDCASWYSLFCNSAGMPEKQMLAAVATDLFKTDYGHKFYSDIGNATWPEGTAGVILAKRQLGMEYEQDIENLKELFNENIGILTVDIDVPEYELYAWESLAATAWTALAVMNNQFWETSVPDLVLPEYETNYEPPIITESFDDPLPETAYEKYLRLTIADLLVGLFDTAVDNATDWSEWNEIPNPEQMFDDAALALAMAPVIGSIPDLGSAVLDGFKGDWFGVGQNSTFAALGLIPVLGMTGDFGRYVSRGSRVGKTISSPRVLNRTFGQTEWVGGSSHTKIFEEFRRGQGLTTQDLMDKTDLMEIARENKDRITLSGELFLWRYIDGLETELLKVVDKTGTRFDYLHFDLTGYNKIEDIMQRELPSYNPGTHIELSAILRNRKLINNSYFYKEGKDITHLINQQWLINSRLQALQSWEEWLVFKGIYFPYIPIQKIAVDAGLTSDELRHLINVDDRLVVMDRDVAQRLVDILPYRVGLDDNIKRLQVLRMSPERVFFEDIDTFREYMIWRSGGKFNVSYFAAEVGLSESTVYRYLNGETAFKVAQDSTIEKFLTSLTPEERAYWLKKFGRNADLSLTDEAILELDYATPIGDLPPRPRLQQPLPGINEPTSKSPGKIFNDISRIKG